MSRTIELYDLDCGVLGLHCAEAQYDYNNEHEGGFDEPPTHREFWLESLKINGLDVLQILDADTLEKLTKITEEAVRDEG